jgi:hypothetical protein
MLLDVTNVGSAPLTITAVEVLLPQGSHSLSLLLRRKTLPCTAGTVCTGSVRDNQFNLDGTFAAGGSATTVAPLAAAGNLSQSSWRPVLGCVDATNAAAAAPTIAVLPAVSITLAAAEVVGLWFYFLDGGQWARVTDANIATGMGTAACNNMPGDPTFAYVDDGALRMSAAMQASTTVSSQAALPGRASRAHALPGGARPSPTGRTCARSHRSSHTLQTACRPRPRRPR